MPDDPTGIRSLIQAGYRYALSLACDRHDAEDLIQQACLRVLRLRGRLVGRSYLFAAIRNLFIEQRRRAAKLTTETLELADSPMAAIDHVRQADNRMEIEHVLSRLRPEEREVLYLSCVQGFSAREIGELTNSPRGTVLSLLSRAKRKLSETASRTASREDSA